MHRFAPVALATILAATAPALLRAQAPTPFTVPQATGKFTDPANLAGERVRPRDGRELPIDGGLSPDGKPDNALGLAQMLRRLSTRASLMLIVAHPDDEDGGMLTYYSRGLGARVAILTLNRGEGGQNQMTGDFEDALGLLRTQELLSADRYMGVTQMFGTEVDFGFTKTKQEAFQKWNHQRVLYDAVRAVRIFRPLIIASTFEGAVTDGHGQHQVSGEIAQEVFKAAGDPNVFPELTREGILPWQPLKVYARVPFSRVTAQGLYDYATGQTVPAEFTNYVTGQKFTTEPTADVTINEGATDPLLTTCSANLSDLPRSLSLLSSREAGSASPATAAKDCTPLSYVQFARIGLGLQRSQIGAGMRMPSPGRADVSYHLYGSRVCAPNLPNPTPNLCTSASTTAMNRHEPGWPTLSRSERVGYRAAREKTPTPPGAPFIRGADEWASRVVAREKTPSVAEMLVSFTPNNEATNHKAPTSRPITAQGGALGNGPGENPTAEGAPYTVANAALANQPSFFDGIDTSWSGIGSLDPDDLDPVKMVEIERHAQNAAAAYPAHPELIAPELATTLKWLDEEIAYITSRSNRTTARANILHELRIKRVQLNDALVFALGIDLAADTTASDVPENTAVGAELHITQSSSQPVLFTHVRSENSTGDFNQSNFNLTLAPQHSVQTSCGLSASQFGLARLPYFFRRSIEEPVYELRGSPDLRNAPFAPPDFTCYLDMQYRGVMFTTGAVAEHAGQPVQAVPPVSVTLSSNAQVLPRGVESFTLAVTVRPPDPRLQTHFSAIAGNNHASSIALTALPWVVKQDGPTTRDGNTVFRFSVPENKRRATTLWTDAVDPHNPGDDYSSGYRPVGYGSLPRVNFYTVATDRVVPVDLKLPPENKRRIAYLPGTGDDVPAALASIGLTPAILKVSDLTPAILSKYDTVVLGVRTYNAHPDLHGAPTQALLDFARNGGNVVVQTQTPEFTAADAPYPLVDRNERVIDETAPVVLLDPGVVAGFSARNGTAENDRALALGLALLTTPNKITPADFNGWIEERGHGFLDTWDPHYTALTEVHDPGAPAEHILPQAPQRGGLITVQVGKGRWTYVAFALYRQLPEAVPGAFRLFVNLLNP